MSGRPEQSEFAPYFSKYINLVDGDDPLAAMEAQVGPTLAFLAGISEEASQQRYEPGKWSIKQVLNHVTDTERAFGFRALWFGRGFEVALPGYDPETGATGAEADSVEWAAHVREFEQVREATLSLYQNLPAQAWTRAGIASGNPFSVRALAFIITGHVTHHLAIVQERYLLPNMSK